MTFRLLITFVLVLGLTGCATRWNPMNWFGGDREERIEVTADEVETDPRGLVTEIVSLSVVPNPGGAVISAMGLPPRQGYWEADLVEVSREDSEMVFEFRVFQPLDPNTRVSTQRSREVLAGTALNRFDLAGIRSITVIGQQNRRTVSRQ
tara:strand:- start:910 stop:1359 length:450 start_codon:yes stop_codon:yes gene_type:complete